MDLGWIEFAVIIGCGLIGFFLVNAFLERRRVNRDSKQEGSKADAEQPSADAAQNEPTASQRLWWEILGVSKDASPDAIKRAFRKEIVGYHPDRVEGLGRELRELAEQKAKEINWAYSAAKRERSFS
ncbi:J domain-containing protein [Bradyrhizobium lupini]